jgi:hypothetical protein
MEWDTRDSWSLCSITPVEQEEFYQILKRALDLCLNKILQQWPLEPNTIVKIDYWVQRKRSAQQIVFRRGDRESILKWNIALAHYLVLHFLSFLNISELEEAVSVGLICCLAHEIDKLPIHFLMKKMFVNFPVDKIPSTELSTTVDLLYCSVLFQV